MKAMGRMLSQSRGGQRVSYVFGEGVNPRLRHLRDGLDESKLPADELLRYGAPRLVYAMTLIENVAGYLLGMERRAKWMVPADGGAGVSRAIVAWWRERWMKGRVSRPGILGEIERHALVHPIVHGARVRLGVPRITGEPPVPRRFVPADHQLPDDEAVPICGQAFEAFDEIGIGTIERFGAEVFGAAVGTGQGRLAGPIGVVGVEIGVLWPVEAAARGGDGDARAGFLDPPARPGEEIVEVGIGGAGAVLLFGPS